MSTGTGAFRDHPRRAIEQARAEGRKEGLSEGEKTGREAGYLEGKADGVKEGYEAGASEGRRMGAEDERARIKRDINLLSASALIEEKSYKPY